MTYDDNSNNDVDCFGWCLISACFVVFCGEGLTLLVPHLLSRQSPWKKSKLKIFILAGKDPVLAKTEMLSLLDKFRIKAHDVVPVDMDQPPAPVQYGNF